MSNSERIDLNRLSAMVRARRGKKGLRQMAEEITGVSAPTLSRIEQGNMPDLETFARICTWLHESPETFFKSADAQACPVGLTEVGAPPEKIEAFLRADRTLAPETIDALGKMIRLAYDHASQGKLG